MGSMASMRFNGFNEVQRGSKAFKEIAAGRDPIRLRDPEDLRCCENTTKRWCCRNATPGRRVLQKNNNDDGEIDRGVA